MEPEKKSSGALVGLVVIIIILVIGGIYMWQLEDKEAVSQPETITIEDSGELDALEQDLETTDTNLDIDLDTVN